MDCTKAIKDLDSDLTKPSRILNPTSLKSGESLLIQGCKNFIILNCWIYNSPTNGMAQCILINGNDTTHNLCIGYADGTNIYVLLRYSKETITIMRLYSEGYWGGTSTVTLEAYTI